MTRRPAVFLLLALTCWTTTSTAQTSRKPRGVELRIGERLTRVAGVGPCSADWTGSLTSGTTWLIRLTNSVGSGDSYGSGTDVFMLAELVGRFEGKLKLKRFVRDSSTYRRTIGEQQDADPPNPDEERCIAEAPGELARRVSGVSFEDDRLWTGSFVRTRRAPQYLVVNEERRLAWVGMDIEELARVLPEIVFGTWDLEQARADWETELRRRQAVDAEFPKLIKEGRKLFANYRYTEDPEPYVDFYERLAEAHPDYAGARFCVLDFHVKAGRVEEVRRSVAKMLEGPLGAHFLTLGSLTSYLSGQVSGRDRAYAELGLTLAERAAEYVPDPILQPRALTILSVAHKGMGDHGAAAEFYAEAARLRRPALPQVYRDLDERTVEGLRERAAAQRAGPARAP